MPSKRRLVISEICFGTEKAGLLDFSYKKCALAAHKNSTYSRQNSTIEYRLPETST